MRKVCTTIQEVGEKGLESRSVSIESDWVHKRDRVVLKLDDGFQIRLKAKDLIAAVQNATNFTAEE
jgi:hypothetical protein